MKRFISMLLTIVMCISVATSIMVPVSAAYRENNFIYISNTEFKGDSITYTVGIKAGVKKLTGANIKLRYNADELRVSECVENTSGIQGIYVKGEVKNNPDEYVVAFISTTGFTAAADTKFAEFTLKLASPEVRPLAKVEFECVEFITDDGIANDVEKKDGTPASLGYHEFLALEAPTVTAVDSLNKSLKVSWTESPNAESYTIFRSPDGGAWEEVATIPAATTEYTDNTIEQGKIYSYTVTANNDSGSTEKKASELTGMYFGSIESIATSPAENGINITWSKLDGADEYELSRKNVDESNFTVLATLKGEDSTSYLDTTAQSGVKYNYSVRAIKAPYTAAMTAEIPTQMFIGKAGIAAVNTPEGINVTIIAVGGGETYILSKSANGGEYAEIKTFTSSEFNDGKLVYTDSDVAENGEYNYSVKAIAEGIEGASTELSANITKLATPVLLKDSIKNTDNGIEFSWEAVGSAASYSVYRKTAGEDFSFLASSYSTQYTDRTAKSGVEYTYTVSANDSNGGIGSYDNEGCSLKRLDAPEGISTITVAGGVKLTFNAVDGAQSYTVYRAADGGEFVAVADVTDTEYIDTTAEKDVLYRYTVSASSDNGAYVSTYNTAGVQGKNFGTVTELSYEVLANGIRLHWNALSGATGYKVYRKTENDTGYALVKSIEGKAVNTYDDTAAQGGVSYNYKVEAFSGACYGEMTAPVITAKYLKAPVMDAANAGDGVIKVTISNVYGADKYILERADGSGEGIVFAELAVIETTGEQIDYLDTKDIVAGNVYTYRVKAVDTTLESAYVTDVVVKMIAPVITDISNEIAGIQIEWTKVLDATGYNIYRKRPEDKEWKLIRGNTSNTKYIDGTVGSGDEYYYSVEAITPDGLTGYNLTGVGIVFLETPDLISASNSVGGVTFKWNKVSGATGYRIYRKTSGGWKYIETVSSKKTSYKDTGVKSGTTYYYTVKAQFTDDDGVTSYSQYFSSGIKVKYIASPDVKKVSNVSSGIKVEWGKVSKASGYYIYRKGNGSGWKKIKTVKSGSTTSYIDEAVAKKDGINYRYTVRAYGSSCTSDFEDGLVMKRLSTPSVKSATSSKSGITVKWGKVSGSSGYYIYRKTGSSSYKKIATVKGGSKSSYVDKTARKGKTYRYTVKAYNGSYTSAYNSTGKSCKDRY